VLNALIELLRDIRNWLDPFVVVADYERGVLIRFGHIHDEALGPGLHWKWWGCDRIEVEPINERTIDLPNVYVTLSDGRTRAVSANLVLVTRDPVLMRRSLYEDDQSVNRRAAGVLAGWAREGDRDERALARRIREALRPWGVQCRRVELTTDVVLKVHGHMVEMA
jgi:regulator of protease activity HflC (stomatin/prohibitin superfamily)